MSDMVTEVHAAFAERMRMLRPAVQESARLEQAIAALAGPTPKVASSGRPLSHRTRQALAHIVGHPGLNTTQIAAAIDVPAASLYAALPRLRERGLIVNRGHRWYSALPPAHSAD